jgi:hypothetical protein
MHAAILIDWSRGVRLPEQGLLVRDVLTEALGLLHQFMGALYLYRQAGAMLKNEGFEVHHSTDDTLTRAHGN